MVRKWNNVVADYRLKKQYPDFKYFKDFVFKEAEKANDPTSSLYAVRKEESEVGKKPKYYGRNPNPGNKLRSGSDEAYFDDGDDCSSEHFEKVSGDDSSSEHSDQEETSDADDDDDSSSEHNDQEETFDNGDDSSSEHSDQFGTISGDDGDDSLSLIHI